LAEITQFALRERSERSQRPLTRALALTLLIIFTRCFSPSYFYSLWRRSLALLPIYTRGNNAFIQTVVTPFNLNLVSRKLLAVFLEKLRAQKTERRARERKKER
jgi:hypothetical protein